MYQLYPHDMVQRITDGVFFRADAVNPDQQEYLAWLAGGGIPLPIQGPSLAEAKAALAAEIAAEFEAALAPLKAEYPESEQQTWDQQAAEATAYATDQAAPAPLIRAMATARGIPVADLANRILRNEAAWKSISGALIGQRQAYRDRLDAATSIEDVEAIAVAYSLPGA